MESKVNGDPKTGAANVKVGVRAGDEQVNARAGAFADNKGFDKPATKGFDNSVSKIFDKPVSKGIYAGVNHDKHGLSVEHSHTEHMSKSTTFAGQTNLFQNKQGELNATAFHTQKPNQNQFGGGLNMNTTSGHSGSLGVTHTPNHNMTTMDASGKVNLMTSGNLNVHATANASRHVSGPFRGHSEARVGMGLNYNF